MTRSDRREFLKQAGAGMVGLATTPFIGSLGSASSTHARGQMQSYMWNRKPLRQLSFAKLPITSFQPGGWVRVALERQRDGMNGHLGEISIWLTKENNAWLSPQGKGDYGWEELPYWLKGYARIGYLLNDPAPIKEAKVWIEGALKNQRPNGQFGPPDRDEEGNLDVWPQMLMLNVLQSWYEYSGDARVIEVMRKYFRWQMTVPDGKLLTSWAAWRAGDNLASIYWLYNITGDDFLLDVATKIDRNAANWRQDGVPPDFWHVVNIAQGFRQPAIYYQQSGNKQDLEASYTNFKYVRQIYGQVPGGMFGADEDAQEGHTDPHQATELDGMIEQIGSNGMMLAISGDPMWAENSEIIAFNSMPAAFMPDYRSLRYLTAPNMAIADSKDHSPGLANQGPYLVMNPLSHRCCQHNSSCAWPNYVEYSWMATPDQGLAAQLYLEGSVRAQAGKPGTEVTLKTSTRYPFEDTIEMEVRSPQAVEFPLWLRIPSWTKGATIQVNGQDQSVDAKPGAYARLVRSWRSGDRVKLRLPMSFQIDRWERNKNSASVNYGPLTLSLKIDERYETVDSTKTALPSSRWQKSLDTAKWPSFEIYPRSDWNYGLVLPEENPERAFTVVPKSWPADGYPFTNEAAPLEIKAQGKQLPQWKIDENGLCGELPQSPVSTDEASVPITLVPMGGARLRIASFPVVG